MKQMIFAVSASLLFLLPSVTLASKRSSHKRAHSTGHAKSSKRPKITIHGTAPTPQPPVEPAPSEPKGAPAMEARSEHALPESRPAAVAEPKPAPAMAEPAPAPAQKPPSVVVNTQSNPATQAVDNVEPGKRR